MKESYQDGTSHQAIDSNQLLDRLSGYGVIAGGEVTDGSEPYHIEVSAVDAYFDGTQSSETSTTLDLQPSVDSFNPRKVLICITENGVTIEEGEPEQPRPRGNIRFRTNRPAYPDLHDVTGVIPLAGIWVDSGAEEIISDDIEDRRQPPNASLRTLTLEDLIINTGITDAAGVDHEGELADRSDVRTDGEIEQTINDDPDHGATADHDYFTDVDARDAVEDTTDAADLSGAVGTDGQHLVTDGTSPFWQDMPGPENNQSLDTTDDVQFNSVTQADAIINNEVTWPDGTTTTSSPSAEAGNVSVLPDLGDVSVGTLANRQAADGSQGWYFTNDSNGIFYDTGSWSLIAENPGNIDPNDLGFDPVTQAEGHVTVSSGTHLSGGGQVNVGESITLNVDEASLDTYLDQSYVKEGTELDNLAITHGGDTLDGTYTLPSGNAIELGNGWQFTDDGSGNAVLNKGSGDGYEVRATKDTNGNSRIEVDGLKLATESFGNSTFIKQSNEGNLDVASADSVPGSGVDGQVESAAQADSANSVPGSGVNGQVGSAAQADNSAALGNYDSSEVFTIQSASIPSTTLPAGGSKWVPLHTFGRVFRLLSVEKFNGAFNANTGDELHIMGSDGNRKFYMSGGTGDARGRVNNPLTTVSGVGRLKFMIHNATSTQQTFGAHIRYVITPS